MQTVNHQEKAEVAELASDKTDLKLKRLKEPKKDNIHLQAIQYSKKT